MDDTEFHLAVAHMTNMAKTSTDIDQLFRFKIGDIVYLKTALSDARAAKKAGANLALPFSGVVAGRILEECPGSIQKFYSVNTATGVGRSLEEILIGEEEYLAYLTEFGNRVSARTMKDLVDAMNVFNYGENRDPGPEGENK